MTYPGTDDINEYLSRNCLVHLRPLITSPADLAKESPCRSQMVREGCAQEIGEKQMGCAHVAILAQMSIGRTLDTTYRSWCGRPAPDVVA